MTFIHKWIPSATGTNETTLLLLHGTGGNEEDLFPLARFLAPHAAMLGVRGKVLENGMPRFFRRLAEGVFDEEDLIFRTHELARFIEEATKTYSLNPERIYAVGYSNGANIAASLLFLEPAILSGAVLFRAMVPLEPAELPDLAGKRVLMLSGRHDPIVPPNNSERLAQMFQQAGADIALNWKNAGHGLTNSELAVARKWMEQLQN
ncbi:phospholipase/carboxylesterase [Alicyclobacillus hesperidum subsp. aegles]|uniref:alpha/beta hydrolase n=1 Tax=Alicyclobacillus hesperidum TaxID=89784 RepID=UPI0007192E04|nr:alpha/beta hydrolase [Alicyclobacillus hesperidum]GLG01302.1 phospholipase/carboxylesterase [Alicyclobacillus hesperidum subsp. aegles]